MSQPCPQCRRTLPSTDDPVRFCPFCGCRLGQATVTDPKYDLTGSYAATPDDLDEITPTQVGGYRIVRPLGAGGMGKVFEAEPVAGGPHVALKLLSHRLQANPVSVERFRQEGRLAAQIAHPRCVFVLGADTDHGRPYILMELMPGDTLKDLVDRRGPLPAVEAIRITLDVIDGLMEAHRLGVIHRDVKPSNCFVLPDGRVKVGDFGLSKSLSAGAQLTTSGAFLGTVLYASPEQIKGEPVDYASDVYSVCGTLFHLLTGRAPFYHESATAALSKIITEDPPDVRSLNAAVPADLARVVHKGLERDREQRYESLAELRRDLAALIPAQLTVGGMGVRIGAYLLDELIVRVFLVAPLVVATLLLLPAPAIPFVTPLTMFGYFTVMEGWLGWSLGKRLLGLRTCRQGTTLAPGVRRSAVRTFVFGLLLWVPLSIVDLRPDGFWGRGLRPLSLVPLVVGLAALTVTMRRRNDFRGLHERASDTCVLRLPQVPRPLKLVGRRGDRLAAIPDRTDPFPATIGHYAIQRAKAVNDGWIALGEDGVLGRRVLIRLRPEGSPRANRPHGRPGRLWALSQGTAAVAGKAYHWEAFVAPIGAPIADVVTPREPVRWPEARSILEQLADECVAGEADRTLPEPLTLDQVWVQADGRVQVLEFPLAPGAPLSPTELLRQSAAVLLEGAPRADADRGPLRAPVPRRERPWLDRVFGGPAVTSAEVAGSLAVSRHLPSRVSRGARAIQCGALALLTAAFVAFNAIDAGVYPMVEVLNDDAHLQQQVQLSIVSRDLEAESPAIRIEARDEIRSRIARESAALSERQPPLLDFEQGVVDWFVEASVPSKPDERDALRDEWLSASEYQSPGPIVLDWPSLILTLWVWPVGMTILAFILRGSVSHGLTAVAVERSDGGRYRRRQAAFRCLLVWGPVVLLQTAALVVRAVAPQTLGLSLALWLAALMLLPLYFLVAMVDPERGPHDRLMNTWVVPR